MTVTWHIDTLSVANLEAVRNPPTRYKAPAWSNAGGAGKAKGKANG